MLQLIKTTVATVALAGPAIAGSDPVCMKTAELEAALVDWHGEKPVRQIDDSTYLWAAGIGGTWTIISQAEDGTSCTLQHGQNWTGEEQGGDLALSFADTDKMLFAPVSGKDMVSRDRALIQKLWRPYRDVFFERGGDNADVAVIQVLPTQAEYWDNDKGKIALAVEMTTAYFI
jgi:hypothetical protein